ncbi:hypothetical protein HYT53_03540 [Candidatus Woesearchaeota archaeon]|nr:hypothetical protein [Candidatus Woesearchaeota archaeon]
MINKIPINIATPGKADDFQLLREMQHKKLQQIKERVAHKLSTLNELGVKNCICCKKQVNIAMKGFIVLVIDLECFERPERNPELINPLRKAWKG